MDRFAQTNLQLYEQLLAAAYPEGDVTAIHHAYGVAARLSPNAFRGSGKPLLAHLIGTASVLVSVKAPTPCVIAGLLHAAYTLGDFGAGYAGISGPKRDRLRQLVGPEVEDLVARYTHLEWTIGTLAAIRRNLAGMSAVDRAIVLIRIANELDDHLDLGALYCHDAEHRKRKAAAMQPAVDLARELGLPELAEDLHRALAAVRNGSVPPALRGDHADTFVLPPITRRSWQIVRLGQTLRQRFGRFLP